MLQNYTIDHHKKYQEASIQIPLDRSAGTINFSHHQQRGQLFVHIQLESAQASWESWHDCASISLNLPMIYAFYRRPWPPPHLKFIQMLGARECESLQAYRAAHVLNGTHWAVELHLGVTLQSYPFIYSLGEMQSFATVFTQMRENEMTDCRSASLT